MITKEKPRREGRGFRNVFALAGNDTNGERKSVYVCVQGSIWRARKQDRKP